MLQIAIVVRDPDAALSTYVDDYGLGPWETYEFNPGNVTDLRESGQPAERSWRLAGHHGRPGMWELIAALDDESIYARFLAEKARAWRRRPNGATVCSQRRVQRRESRLPRPDRDLGVITEIFSGTPTADCKPDATEP